jgi:hypothetical protein
MLSNPVVFEPAPGATVVLTVDGWEVDELDIRPPVGPGVRRVRALRLDLATLSGDRAGGYVDVVAARLIEDLLPWLQGEGFRRRRFSITRDGEGLTTRYQVRVSAVGA